jgi:hypothetical protein
LRDWYTDAINSPRSSAIRSAIRFLLFLKHHQPRPTQASDRLFREVSEEVLRPLKGASARSPLLWAVYGQSFPWLAALFGDLVAWLQETIFPFDSASATVFEASWSSYLRYSRFFNESYVQLRPVYAHALEGFKERENDEESLSSEAAWHLVVAFLRGLEDSEPDSLIDSLFQVASPSILKAVVLRMGAELSDRTRVIPPEIKERFMQMWERVKREIQAHADGSFGIVAAAFGPWVFADLDRQWLVENLEYALRVHPSVEQSHRVLERLAEWVESDACPVASITLAMVKFPPDRWALSLWKKSLEKILSHGLRSEDPDARHAASEAQALCVRAGLVDFRNL